MSSDFATCPTAIKSLDYCAQDRLQDSITSQANTAFTSITSTSLSNYINDISNTALNQLAQAIVKPLECFPSTLFVPDLKELHTNLV